MIIYRLENEKGFGPYKNCNWDFWDQLPIDRKRNFIANPEDDFGVFTLTEIYEKLKAPRRKIFFGCTSKKSLLEWFGVNHEFELLRGGFLINTYETDRFVISNSGKQVMFVKESNFKQRMKQLWFEFKAVLKFKFQYY